MPVPKTASVTAARFRAMRRPRRYDPDALNVNFPFEYLVAHGQDIIPLYCELMAKALQDDVDRNPRAKNTTGSTLSKGTLVKVTATKLSAQTSAVASTSPSAGNSKVLNVAATYEAGQMVEVVSGGLTDVTIVEAASAGVSVTLEHLEHAHVTPTITARPAYEAVLADADDADGAWYVVGEDIANGAYGQLYAAIELTGLNTTGRTVEEWLYLSGTAGAYTATEPSGSGQISQVVGIVSNVHATEGRIIFFPGARIIRKFGTASLQSGAGYGQKVNFAGSGAPTTGDDSGDGYGIGSLWFDVTNDRLYACFDATIGAAVWVQIAGPLHAVKSADQTKNSDTIFADDSELKVYLPSAGKYKINAILSVGTSAAPGIKYGLSGPTLVHMMVVVDQTYNFINELAGYTGGAYYAWHPAGSPDVGWVRMDGVLEVSAAGWLAISWAQDTSDAADTKIKKFSFLSAERAVA